MPPLMVNPVAVIITDLVTDLEEAEDDLDIADEFFNKIQDSPTMKELLEENATADPTDAAGK